MSFEHLTDREKQVLFNLINYYIKSADPVGSRVIANRFEMGISSATIRNTLQDLEELGLVEQPHTSAGRIPTDLGYRFYVDSLLKPRGLSNSEKQWIKEAILREGRGINEILGQTCRVLSDITQQLGVSIAPRFEEGILKRLDLIPISDDHIMAVVVVEAGLARTVIIEIDAAVSESALREVEVVLNERLSGLTLGDIRKTISERLADVSGHGRLVKLMVDSRDMIWCARGGEGVRVSGADHLVQQPEFSDVQKISELIKFLEDGTALGRFIEVAREAGVVITIGKENRVAEIVNCSLVSSSYKAGNISGVVGVVGPTRMAYSKLASVVEYTAKAITEVLSGMDKNEE